MPIFPSPLAAVALATVKVVGYAWYARGLNCKTEQNVSLLKFGATKTGLGLLGGVTYLSALPFLVSEDRWSDFTVFLGAAPIRLLVWTLVLRLFYDFRGSRSLMVWAVILGTAWSYALDAVMWLIYKVIPGMTMPVC